ncbi:hypothetical protein PV10_00965 [Exophiala mesophila]|uniref:Uncharacterized protein n=1 Tax=Exophiala mesophila TaxID=212818 RepID=A0A0D1Y923_EXOME|nr:uncharacterized protein PV10_00965 [Exophiala mesophila]KIV97186.1 hypothetical protein PV10_00965 [Exophiala mesophila]
MRPSWIQAATFLSSLSSAAIIPRTPTFDHSAKDITTVAGTTGCFDGSEDGLELTLEIDSAEEECARTRPRLNGVALTSNAHDAVLTGNVALKVRRSDDSGDADIEAKFTSTCIRGQASFLTVQFTNPTADEQSQAASGFTTSFTQVGQPAILRLRNRPTVNVQPLKICKSWVFPSDSQRVSVTAPSPTPDTSRDEMMDDQYKKLDELFGQLADKHDEIYSTEKAIISMVKDEFRSCSTIRCWWDTAKSKIPVVCRMFTAHWTHHKTRVSGCIQGKAQAACTAEEPSVPAKEHGSTNDEVDGVVKAATSTFATRADTTPTATPTVNDMHSAVAPTVLPTALGADVSTSEPSSAKDTPDSEPQGHHGPPPGFKPWKGDGPPPWHHGPPPWFKPGDHHGPPPWFKPGEGHHGPPPWFKPGEGHHGPPPPWRGDSPPPWAPGHEDHTQEEPESHSTRLGLGSFHLTGDRSVFDYKLTLIVILFILTIIIGGVFFKLIRMCRDPRRRAERAAWVEERRTRRLYRKAACKHKWRTWWSQLFCLMSANFEEKMGNLPGQGRENENVLHRQIRALRDVASLVRNLVAAEEGRSQIQADGASESSSQSDQTPAPVYIASLSPPPSYFAPPQYEEEIRGEITVVEGFTYTPSHSGYTPSSIGDAAESSIVDCSPRLSFETGRSTVFTRDAE